MVPSRAEKEIPIHPPLEFGPFRLDERQHLLTTKGQPICLQPKCFELLCLLVKNQGRLLEKGSLMRELWPETFVEEANLSNMVALLRKALGDSPSAPRYIQTVPKLGYRFIAPVNYTFPVAGPVREADEPRPAIRILVFPFRFAAGCTDLEHLAYSLPEAISTTLSELNAFTVRSMQVAMRFDPIHWDPSIVGSEANVDVILSGSIEHSSWGIHCVTQLTETVSGTLLWSRSWEMDTSELFRFHQGVSQLVAGTLIRGGCETTRHSLQIDAPTSAEAYELYLRANHLCLRRAPESMALARDLYIACIEKDANYAPAWARLGRCYGFLKKFGNEGGSNGRAALEAIERALTLNPKLTIAHRVYTSIQADMGMAENAMVRLLRRAQENDSDAEIFAALVQACRYCGQLDASLAAHRRAIERNPEAHTSVAHTFFVLSDFERALYWYGNDASIYLDALTLASMGREQEASALLWTRREKFCLLPAAMHSLHAYLEKDYARAIAVLEEAKRAELLDPEVHYYLGRQAARLGAADLATSFLLRSIEQGYWCTTCLTQDAWLEPLRSTVKFAEILDLASRREGGSRTAFVSAGGERVLFNEPTQ